ncbi:MAG: DUF6573 family protein [bacterium]
MEHTQVIHSYSRKQALADGVLVDQSELGRLAGFLVPVAVTAELLAIAREHEAHRDGRPLRWFLHKAISIARLNASYARNKNSRHFLFEVSFNEEHEERATELLRCELGPDDDGQPCVTLMLFWQD